MRKLFLLLLGIAIGIIATYFYLNPNQNFESMKPPKGLISPKEMRALDKAFNSRHQLISDSIVGKPDNRSAWFAIDDIIAYLDHAKHQAADLGYTLDGIRIYLGAHANTEEGVGLTTTFIAPTGKRKSSDGGMVSAAQGGKGDIDGGDGLNDGSSGVPPGANYPQ